MLKDSRISPGYLSNFALRVACSRGQAEIMELLLKDPRTPQIHRDSILTIACRNGFTEGVRILLTYGNVRATDEDMFVTVERGHVGVLKILLQDESLNPGAFNSFAICDATFYGHVECVKLLLQDPRVDPTVDNNYPLRMTWEKNHKEIERLLLEDPRVIAEKRLKKFRSNNMGHF
eukprot:TRINITY_DN10154_c0_g1_i2.p1 TRINITY_DN10154_c0_g1~~TRINITY_DN10154_c0_g1_i2.p1  ORF type:complete len:176 (-),score=27.42 TRINITY_DN10154_c0_g1_i2:22-549(-)